MDEEGINKNSFVILNGKEYIFYNLHKMVINCETPKEKNEKSTIIKGHQGHSLAEVLAFQTIQ